MFNFLFPLILILSFQRPAASQTEDLINGQPVRWGDYPEVVQIMTASSLCSATLVGPNALLTAGHCIKSDGKVRIRVSEVREAQGVEGKCEQHPVYRDNEWDYDLALCKLEKKVRAKFAHVSGSGPRIGEDVILIGYGCIRKDPPRGGNDGVLRVGKAPVYKLPGSSGDGWYYTRSSTTLCFGDSGGPSFKMVSNPSSELHVILGVNSRGDIVERSLLAPVYVSKAREWMLKWAKRNRVDVCGLNDDCE